MAGLYFSVGGLEEVETHVSFHLQIKRQEHPLFAICCLEDINHHTSQ